jgi:hypothetical protein
MATFKAKKNVASTFKEKNKRKSLVELIEERRIRIKQRPKQELRKESQNNNLRDLR